VIHLSLPPLLAFGKDWWLPTNYSRHGGDIDMLFYWIFWLTMIIFIVTELVLVVFLIQYRHRPEKQKAKFTHGNTRLEMTWTLAPAVILAILALASKKVWDNYRYSPELDNPSRAKVLVIGEQFKWNVIYPGPDGKFGRYLLFPKPTDVAWPVGPDGKSHKFNGVPGPASLPYDKALGAIRDFIASDPGARLGKDYSDPDGADDDFASSLARPLYVPVDRPVEVQIGSKDVIHDFYLPNFRAQLYAVPGMRGRFTFTPVPESLEVQNALATPVHYKVDDLPAMLASPAYKDLVADVNESIAGDPHVNKDKTGWRLVNISNPAKPTTVTRNGAVIDAAVLARMQAAGITEFTGHRPGYFVIACAQICGSGHYTMQGQLIVLSQKEFDQRFPAAPNAPVKTAMASK
jgi:heme/copper-type cytochrome/quinol oxidase subunit 2